MLKKEIFIFSIFFFCAISSMAQDKSLPSLETTGTGEMKVTPDHTILYLDLSAQDMNFNNSVQELNKKASILEKELITAGFSKADLKTTGYTVNKNINYTSRGPVDSGYIARQTFLVEFPMDQAKIVKLVKTLSESKVGISFNFAFNLSEQKEKEVQTELIKKAVADAKQKARVLSEASGVPLKRIIHINYGKLDSEPRPFTTMRQESHSGKDNFSGFTVNEMNLTEQVSISWEIDQPN